MDSSSSVLLKNTCRVCLISNPYSVYHDINKYSPKLGKIIAVAIMECATVKIKLNDDFPDQICEKCLNKLVYSQEFKKVCIASDSKQTGCSSVSSDYKNKSQPSPVVATVTSNLSSTEGIISDKRRLTSDILIKDIDSRKQSGYDTKQKDILFNYQSGITNTNKYPQSINVMIPPKFPTFSSVEQKKPFVPFHIQEKNNSRQSNTAQVEKQFESSNSSGNLVPPDPPIISNIDQRKQVVQNYIPFNSQEKNNPRHSTATLQLEKHNEEDDNDLVPPDPPIISEAEQKNEVRNYYRKYVTNPTLPVEPFNPIKDDCKCLKCGKIFDNPDEVRIHINGCELFCECGKRFSKTSQLFHHKRVKGCPASKKMKMDNQDMDIDSPDVSQSMKGKKKNKKWNKNVPGQQHRCYGCSLFFDKVGTLLEHRPFCENLSWRTQARAFHKCFECDEKFITKDQLLKHKGTTCKGTKWMEGDKFKCHFCFELFDSLLDVKTHRKSKTCANVNLTCLNCDKTFEDIKVLNRHRMRRECMNPHRKNKQ